MATKVLIVLLCIPLVLGSAGCVMTGWVLPVDDHSSVHWGGLSRHHPEPGSFEYRSALVWGFVGDTLWIPILGLGFLWWALDALYVWVLGGGYAERWYALYGHPDTRERDDRDRGYR